MKTPPDRNDPLLQSLVEDANELPHAAAAEARSRLRSRKNLRHVITLVLVLAAAIWSTKYSSDRGVARKVSTEGRSAESPKLSTRSGYVKAYPDGSAASVDPIAPDATEQEKQLLKELPDVPLLIVRNDAGQVTRVHVFESTR